MWQIVCAHSELIVTLHCLKEKDLFRITNLKERKNIMLTLVVLAIVAATVAQAIKLGHRIDLQK